MTPTELQVPHSRVLSRAVALLLQHESAARYVSDYDVNNAYQYVIAREETQVSWLQHALLDLGASFRRDPAPPRRQTSAQGQGRNARELAETDGRDNQRFVEQWRDRVETR